MCVLKKADVKRVERKTNNSQYGGFRSTFAIFACPLFTRCLGNRQAGAACCTEKEAQVNVKRMLEEKAKIGQNIYIKKKNTAKAEKLKIED